MRVLITGISGFLGRHLAPKLLAAGHEVFGIRLDRGEALEGVVERQLDILDSVLLNHVVAELAPEVIVHLAGLSHVGRSWDRMPEYFAVNVLGVENVLGAAPGVKMVLASSGEIYGSVPAAEQPITEGRRPAPRSPYGLTKAAAERLVLASGGVVVRMFNLVGPGQESTFALPDFAEQLAGQMRQASAVLEVGNLEARRDFVHVLDGADAFVTLVEHGVEGETYNLGGGKPVSIRGALDRLIEISGLKVSVQVDADRLRPVDIPLLSADASKLEALGWRARRGLTGALKDLWQVTLASASVGREPT
jgi:GDP-4-dehydro-6-deoxy-D-mannose reductase